MSKSLKKDFKLAVQVQKENFAPGTLSRLRIRSGINFSIIPTPTEFRLNPLAHKVQDFSLLNSSEIPDMKANKSVFSSSKVPNTRFANHHLTVLHSQYLYLLQPVLLLLAQLNNQAEAQ